MIQPSELLLKIFTAKFLDNSKEHIQFQYIFTKTANLEQMGSFRYNFPKVFKTSALQISEINSWKLWNLLLLYGCREICIEDCLIPLFLLCLLKYDNCSIFQNPIFISYIKRTKYLARQSFRASFEKCN